MLSRGRRWRNQRIVEKSCGGILVGRGGVPGGGGRERCAGKSDGERALGGVLRESNSPIVVVSVRDAAGRPLQDDDARSSLSFSSRGRVTVEFGAPAMPGEGACVAQALRSLKCSTCPADLPRHATAIKRCANFARKRNNFT